jgi:malic enzyme
MALADCAESRLGKLKVTPTEPAENREELSSVNSPPVAEPRREIAGATSTVFGATARGAVVPQIVRASVGHQRGETSAILFNV